MNIFKHTVLCKSNANVFRRNSRLFLAFRRKNIEFSTKSHDNSRSVLFPTTRIIKRQFVWNENEFDFSSEKSLCSINDFGRASEISLFISSARTFPSILLTTSCQVRSCRDDIDSFARSSHNGGKLVYLHNSSIRLTWMYFKGFLTV